MLPAFLNLHSSKIIQYVYSSGLLIQIPGIPKMLKYKNRMYKPPKTNVCLFEDDDYSKQLFLYCYSFLSSFSLLLLY